MQDVLLQSFQKIKGLEFDREGGLQAYLGRRSSIGFATNSGRRAGGPARWSSSQLTPMRGRRRSKRRSGARRRDATRPRSPGCGPIDREAIIARIELGFTYDEVAQSAGQAHCQRSRMAVERALVRLIERLRE